jgi:hypothetical protein
MMSLHTKNESKMMLVEQPMAVVDGFQVLVVSLPAAGK